MNAENPTSDEKRKESKNRYEAKTEFKTLSVRVHINRRDAVKIFALTGKCQKYEREVKMLNEKISALEGLVRRYQDEALR